MAARRTAKQAAALKKAQLASAAKRKAAKGFDVSKAVAHYNQHGPPKGFKGIDVDTVSIPKSGVKKPASAKAKARKATKHTKQSYGITPVNGPQSEYDRWKSGWGMGD